MFITTLWTVLEKRQPHKLENFMTITSKLINIFASNKCVALAASHNFNIWFFLLLSPNYLFSMCFVLKLIDYLKVYFIVSKFVGALNFVLISNLVI